MTFVRSMTVPQLGKGAGYAIWAFRSIALGHADCPALLRNYKLSFGDYYRPALGAMQLLTHAFACGAKRRIGLATPGCCGVTSDELCIVAMLSAAQSQDAPRRDAHLRWLTGGRNEEAVRNAAEAVGSVFDAAHIPIESPPIAIATPQPSRALKIVHAAGHA